MILPGKEESEPAAFMREIIAEAVRSDPQNYSEAVLGKKPEDYCAWIRTSEVMLYYYYFYHTTQFYCLLHDHDLWCYFMRITE
jgi:hypothetical protein